MSVSWNLLNYPSLHLQRRRRHRVLTTLLGLAVGGLLAEGTRHWLDKGLQGLHAQKAQLQQEWLEHSERVKHRRQHKVAIEKNRQQAQHLRQIAQQHQAWTALNEAFNSEMQGSNWRLLRLQLEPGRLELQGWSRDFESLGAARQKLMDHLQSHVPEPKPAQEMPHDGVRQTRVSNRSGAAAGPVEGAGLEFVWVTAWPVFQPAAAPTHNQGAGDKP
ncbi:MAG: hypothetical protein HEQ17_11560 [Limnohabitans sp.]|jgi:hypothetical protein|uniref:hypothetical protein n=1 Tax=Limnohabitans sp. TaxID=1907725 RepID=UPI0025E5CADE|nr:hypothetical protein [Limnohabitans sp.]MCO4089536.1 hypothetical protein [Limnohabitans sp.]